MKLNKVLVINIHFYLCLLLIYRVVVSVVEFLMSPLFVISCCSKLLKQEFCFQNYIVLIIRLSQIFQVALRIFE